MKNLLTSLILGAIVNIILGILPAVYYVSSPGTILFSNGFNVRVWVGLLITILTFVFLTIKGKIKAH